MVEHLGSGMNRILSFYKKEVFSFRDNFLRIVFKRDNNPTTTQETTRDEIIALLKKNITSMSMKYMLMVGLPIKAP